MAGFLALLHKDLRLEWRSAESTITLASLSLLILVVLVFARDVSASDVPAAAAGALWVALIFAGAAGASRTLLAERENGCLRALVVSPLDHGALYLAKLIAAFIFMAIAEIAAAVMLVLFYNLDFDARLWRLAPVIGLGVLGFAALAILLAAISGRLRAGDLLLPLLVVPLFVPALIAGVKASNMVLAGGTLAGAAIWLKVLVAFDVLFLSAGYLLFEYVLKED